MPDYLRLRTPSSVGELLCLLARTSLDETAVNRVRGLMQQKTDWDQLAAQAERHNVTPLCFRALTGQLDAAAPLEVVDTLRRVFHRNAYDNVRRIQELKRVLDILAHSGIPAMALKGPALTQQAYGDPGMRSYADLDLLLPQARLREALEALRSAGYTSLWKLSQAQEASAMRHGYHYNLAGRGTDSHLELHWSLIDACFSFALPEHEMWSRRVCVELGPVTVETLCPEDQLLYLCFHGAKHFWSQLRMVCDVAELVNRNPDLDWDSLFRVASGSGGERVLKLGLLLAKELLGARLAPHVSARLEGDPTLERLRARAIEFLGMENPEGGPVGRLTAFHLMLFPSFKCKARYLRASLAPKELDVLTFPLPLALSPLYLILRPIRLLFRLKPRREHPADPGVALTADSATGTPD